jgi:FkbM family methyltransferase
MARTIVGRVAPGLLYRYQLQRAARSEPEIGLLPEWCRRDALSIDVGANRGLYSYHMLRYSAAVLAFEPLASMRQLLDAHLGRRIRMYPVALSDVDGHTRLRLPAGAPSWATIDPRNTLGQAGETPIEAITVPTRRLDGYGFNGVGFIKIDVEGHEEHVLRGALETLRENRPTLLVEVEERHNAGSVGRVTALLAGLGYEGFFLDDGRVHPIGEFDASRDQPLEHVGVQGKTGRYINNFFFLPA